MHVIGDAIDDDGLMALVFDDATHVFENLGAPILTEQILPPFDRKDNLNIDLRIRPGHVSLLILYDRRSLAFAITRGDYVIPSGLISRFAIQLQF
jgi:hypothetical protein